MTKQDILHKELSNLYALNKQVNHYFNGSDIHFLPEKMQLLLMDYLKTVCQNEEDAQSLLDQMDVNPANTTDSVAAEMVENLRQIAGQDLDDPVKALGYQMSVNRLLHYHQANLENIRLAGHENDHLMQAHQNLAALLKKLSA